MARFDEIYEKYKKKQQNGTGYPGAVASASGTGTVAAEKNANSGGYKATGRFAGILANYQKNGASFSGVDDSYVQSFFKDAEAFAQKAVEESKNIGWAMATDKAKNEERNQALTDLGNRAKAVKVYLTSNKKSIDPKAYEEYMRFLKNFENDKQSIYDTFLGNTNYYSQWDTKEKYDFHEAHSTPEKRREWYAGLEKRKKELEAQKDQEAAAWQETEANANSYDGFEYSEMEEAHWNKLKAIEEEMKKIGTEMRQYERGGYNEKGQHYGSKRADDALALTMEKDFATLSQQRDHKNPTRQQLDKADSMNNSVNWDYDEMGVLRDAYGNAITTDETGKRVSTKAQEYAVKDKLGVYLSATDKEKEEYMGTIVNGTWGEIIGEGMEGSWDQLNDNEIGVYYYLLNKDSVAAAEKFLQEMTPELNRRAAEKARQAQLEMYNESGLGGKLLLNAATVPANLLGGITGLAQDAAHLIRGEETNPYSSAHSFNAFGNTIRSETAKELEELMPGVKIPLLNFTVGDLYQTIMSRVDSLAAMGIGGSLGGVLLATNAAANEMTRLYEQGASVKQMAWGAAAVGAAELVFETLSIENLKGIKDAKKRFGRIKSALVQGEIEASEEGLTEIANIISNAVVMGSESDWNKLVAANGGDELAAFLEKVRDVAKASFGGFLSGAPAGALASPGKGSQQTTQQKQEASVQARQKEDAPTVGIDGVAWPTREDIERAEAGEAKNVAELQKTTNAVSKPIASYPAEKRNNIMAFLHSVDEGIKKFVEDVKSGDLTFKRQKISDVSGRQAKDIETLLGVDATGYTNDINTNGIQHILIRHGENGKQDHSMAATEDIARIGWVLENYDKAELANEDGKRGKSKEFIDENGLPANQIKFSKKIDGYYYVVEAAFENKYKKLWVQSAYLSKKEDVTQTPDADKTANHGKNAQSEFASPSSKTIIDDTGENVNTGVDMSIDGVAWPTREDIDRMETGEPAQGAETEAEGVAEDFATEDLEGEEDYEETAEDRLDIKRRNLEWQVKENQRLKEEYVQAVDEKIRSAQSMLDSRKDQTTKMAQKLKRRIAELQRQKADQVAEYDRKITRLQERIGKVEEQQKQDHTKENRLEKAYKRIEEEQKQAELDATEEYYREKNALSMEIGDRNKWIRDKAFDLEWEMANWVKGQSRPSPLLKILFQGNYEWRDLSAALDDVKDDPVNFSRYPTDAEVAVRDVLERAYEKETVRLQDLEDRYNKRMKEIEKEAEEKKRKAERIARADLHAKIMEHVRATFQKHGYDYDEVMRKAKNLATLRTVDNTPQRVMEKALGYKEGGILADLTVNKVAQDESKAIQWLNSFTDRKTGLLAKISREYSIKPGSKESQAAQMYAEGFYVNEKNEIVEYTDRELAMDFPDTQVQESIKKMARDPRIRQIYDETLDAINEARERNGYPAIPRLANYFLHFRAQADTFSQLGLPFNPNDIRAKDLPTDLNGVTADLKPGQPYFASSMHRKGKRTSFDLLGGLEMYLNSAKNQIFHIDNIQTLRALRNDLADTFGQANGLENLDELSDAEAEERIKEVFGGHLSTFAKFLNEEANVLAGKTSLIDRGIEGIFGRRAITFLNDLNRQVGSNAVGYSVSSGIVNLDAIPRAVAKGSKRDFAKAVGQMATNLLTNRDDGFAENSPVIIRRKGAERFNRTLWQKLSDPGYALAGAVDGVATELIARMKYNELTRKGMAPQKAHFETDKWVSKLMGDRSLGQQPQIFNSKMLGLITKYQLEVRNNLDSMFYDTIQEEKVSKEYIEDRLERNKKTAAAITYRLVSLAVLQHAFGMGFEALTGNNPSFDLIDVLVKALGIDDWDDDEEEKDTFRENLEEGFIALLEDLPYTSTILNGGRIPISNALPIEEVITGKDKYGNEKSRWKTVLEALPYYLSPGGYGQAKKIWQGTEMYLHENPGSYTRDENGELQLRYPVEEGIAPWLQAALFGKWSGQEAQQYLDEGRRPLTEKQTKEFFESGMTIQQYWDYRDELGKLKKQDEKLALINGMDLSDEQKRVLKSYLFDEEGYAEDNPEKYAFLEEEGIGYLGWKELPDDEQQAWSWAFKHQDEYRHYKKNGVLPGDYTTYQVPMLEFKDEANQAYEWEYNYPDKAVMGDVFEDGVTEYRKYIKAMSELKADKNQSGETVAGSRKQKVTDYINGLDLDYGEKIILYKMEYPAEHGYDWDIVEYLNSRRDLSEEQIVKILEQLGAKVKEDGTVKWK